MKFITYALTALVVLGIELTHENYEEETAGNIVFIKFYTDWCTECKEMGPAWKRLKKTFERSTSSLIAEVNCHGAGDDLCNELMVEHYPTLKYGDPKTLLDYTGEFDYHALWTFAGEHVGPICGPQHLNLCDPNQKENIITFQDLGIEKLREKIDDVMREMDSARSIFDHKVVKMYNDHDKRYYKLKKEKEEKLEDLREENDYGLLKSVISHLEAQYSNHIDL